jgi:hypothetical protein
MIEGVAVSVVRLKPGVEAILFGARQAALGEAKAPAAGLLDYALRLRG